MKKQINILICFIIIVFISCEKHDDNAIEELNIIKVSDDALYYLSDKAILSIEIAENSIWILSSKHCDTCYVAPHMSYIPTISQLTLIKDSSFEYEEPTSIGFPCINHKGILFATSGNKVYKINSIKDYELVLETEGFNFYSLAFDKNDNIWLSGYNGIAFWNGNELKVYDTNNSDLPSDITHGLTIDNSNNVWVTLAFKGLLKIKEDDWEIIPNSEIPGLDEYSYLRSPIVDNENNIWFNVFSPDTNSNILFYNGVDWNYQYPRQNDHYGRLTIDSRGTIWAISNKYDYSTFISSSLAYYKNSEWIEFDISDIDSKVLTVNADDNKVYIGTVKGLIEKSK